MVEWHSPHPTDGEQMAAIAGHHALMGRLCEALGLDPARTDRVVIECAVHDVVKVYVRQNFDDSSTEGALSALTGLVKAGVVEIVPCADVEVSPRGDVSHATPREARSDLARLLAGDVADVAHRLVLADALDEADRGAEATLCRDESRKAYVGWPADGSFARAFVVGLAVRERVNEELDLTDWPSAPRQQFTAVRSLEGHFTTPLPGWMAGKGAMEVRGPGLRATLRLLAGRRFKSNGAYEYDREASGP